MNTVRDLLSSTEFWMGLSLIATSFNVASITDNGTGVYTIAFDTNFSSANYGAGAVSASQIVNVGIFTAGSIQIATRDNAGVSEDATVIMLMAIGDQ